ncbi:FecR family protein [Mucilaginibacter sp. HD30]
MEYSQENLAALLRKQEWSVEEYKWFLHYVNNVDKGELEELMHSQYVESLLDAKGIELPFSAEVLEKIHNRIDETRKPKSGLNLTHWLAIAASLIGVLFFTGLFYVHYSKNDSSQSEAVTLINTDVAPGKNKAILKLSNGSSIVLNEEETRRIAREGDADIMKEGAKLSYKRQPNSVKTEDINTSTLSYNTLSTPRGGQFQLLLADGTKVWLNSASSIQFPAVFSGEERRVKLTGEAYFEVAKNKKLPFIVEVASSQIQVLGTHFNIKAYKEEETPLQATLLEGSIRFNNATGTVLLKPGEQVNLGANGGITVDKDIDADNVLAWKNGLFHFEKQRLESIMRELSRWYDIEVIYKDRIDASFFAEMPKNTNLSDALKALQLTGRVKFTIDGKKVMVFKH